VVLAIALAAVAFGGLERWWISSHTIGTLTSDGAVIGLMALHLLHHGQLPAYMWGQSYGGSLEMDLTAVVFALAGVGTSQLIATTAITSAVAAVCMWRAARHLVGERAALIGALALWVWPALFTWRSLKPGGTYIVGLAVAWIAVGWLVRIRKGDDRTVALAAAGIFCGLAFWSSPMTLQLLIPTLLWSFVALKALGRRFGWIVAGSVLGAMPALVFGATHHFSNLFPPGNGHIYDFVGDRFVQFFEYEMPIAASLRVEGSLHWVLGDVGIALAFALAIGFVVLVRATRRGRAPRCVLPVLALLILPVLYTFNSLADHVGQGRYVLLGSTMGAVLVGVGLDNASKVLVGLVERRRGVLGARGTVRRGLSPLLVWGVGLALLAALGATAVVGEPGNQLAEFPVQGVPMPANDLALRALVREHHVHDAFAGYWIAYRLMFELDESIDVTPLSTGRFPQIRDAVRASPDPAYLFMAASPAPRRLIAWCAAHHIAVSVWRGGRFMVVEPHDRVLPHELPYRVLSVTGPPHPVNALGG
jgi:4-amino-4-deoxy-L-arabinose transferase-like glycosyltransferase